MLRHALPKRTPAYLTRYSSDALCAAPFRRQPRISVTITAAAYYRYHNSGFHRLTRNSTARLDSAAPAAAQGRTTSNTRRPVVESVEDTIYALSSGAGRGGIAVIRISGSGCLDVHRGLCPGKPLPKPRYAGVRTLWEPGSDPANIVDSDALILYFPGPKSATGEDILELHVHGGPATVKAVLAAIPKCTPSASNGKIRYAEPGEFTRRAFLNGRLDLAQVESLGDTLSAETEHQRRAAVGGASGALGKTYESWREQLLHARGEIEALIDFAEDQHFDESPAELLSNVSRLVDDILRSIAQYRLASQRSELLRNGIRIALLGPPNAGKSSLMNLIVGREASIVSAEAGTTRDIVEASLDIRGYLCSFADTAGIRTADGRMTVGLIEQEGIRRARARARDSDVIIVLASVEKSETDDGTFAIMYDAETLQLAAEAKQHIIAVNKTDVVDPSALQSLLHTFETEVLASFPALRTSRPLTLSCRAAASSPSFFPSTSTGPTGTGTIPLSPPPPPPPPPGADVFPCPTTTTPGTSLSSSVLTTDTTKENDAGGIHTLVETLGQSFAALTSLPESRDLQVQLLSVTARQDQLLAECQRHLKDFVACGPDDVVLAAEHLRYAANRLAAITGRGDAGDVEEVLGVVFSRFCVGK